MSSFLAVYLVLKQTSSSSLTHCERCWSTCKQAALLLALIHLGLAAAAGGMQGVGVQGVGVQGVGVQGVREQGVGEQLTLHSC